MKIHYFQRYHEKENVATANTMSDVKAGRVYLADAIEAEMKRDFGI